MKEPSTTASKISDHLLSKYKTAFKVNRNGNLTFDGKTTSIKKLYEEDVDALNSLGVLVDFMKSDKQMLELSIKEHISTTLTNEIEQAKHAEAARLEEGVNSKFKEITNLNLEDVQVMLDIDGTKDKNHENKFLINIKTDEVLKSPSVIGFKAIIGDPKFKAILDYVVPCQKGYDPYLINKTLDDRRWTGKLAGIDAEVPVFNTCIHPAWRYNRDLDKKLSDEDKNFIESSFRTKEDLQYFIDAAYTTITTRMHAYVILFGIKGTGKTTLVEMLINCVGDSNYRKAAQNALKNHFNGYKGEKRLILHDEPILNTPEIMNTLKSDANKQFNIEEKNKESRLVTNFASLWFASNNLRDLHMTYDERRFSTLELVNTTTLERGITDEFMADFAERITTDDFSQRLFNYLEENRSPNFNSMAAHKSPLFHKLVATSLSGWESTLVETITGSEKLNTLDMSIVIDKTDSYRPRKHVTISDFIENYRHYDEKTDRTYSLGEYVKGKSIGNSYIVPSDKYRATIKENNSDLED